MQSLRFSRAFYNFCTAQNARAVHNLSSSSPLTTSPSVLNLLTRRGSATASLSFRARPASITTFRNVSSPFSFSAGAQKTRLFGPRSLGFGSTLAGLGLGLAAFQIQKPTVQCDARPTNPSIAPTRSEPTPTPLQPDDELPPPPQSSLNMFELSFGAITGICAGVFVKKGAKILAFVLGGVFVLLQYLVSVGLIRVNWSRLESGYDKTFYSSSTDAAGKEVSRPPTLYSLFRWIVDFLTADFPPRATFIAGMALGLRLG